MISVFSIVSFASGKADIYIQKIIEKNKYATTLMLNSFTAGLINEETLFYRYTVAVTRHCEASSPKQSLTRSHF